MAEYELYHYGVKGMKWGRRKTRAEYAAEAKTTRESASEWEQMAKYAEQRGKAKKAAKYRSYAAQERAEASSLQRKAGPKKTNKKSSSPKHKTSTGKKSAKKSMSKISGSTLSGVANVASIGSQMAIRMMQNQVAYTTAGYLTDSIFR